MHNLLIRKSIFIFIYLISIFIALIYFYQIKNDNKNNLFDNQIKSLSSIYQASLTIYRSNAKIIFDNIVMQPEVLELLEKLPDSDQTVIDEIHNKLFDMLEGRYNNLKKSLNIEQLHFHDKDGQSFLRMHRKLQYGDNIIDIRHSIKFVHSNKKYIEGFEEGRMFSGYRYVYPIIYNNQYLGSVEISISMHAIINQLTEIFKNKSFSLIIDKTIIKEKLFLSEKSNYINSNINQNFLLDKKVQKKFNIDYFDYCMKLHNEEINKKLSKHKAMVESISLEDDALITFLPIYNINNNFVAYLISFEKNENYVNNENQFLYQILFSISVITIVLSFIYFIIEHTYLVKTEKQKLNLLVDIRTKELKTLLEEKVENYRDTLFTLINLIEERDSYTAGHTKRTAEYSKLIAIEMGYNKEEINLLYEAAILHDIGKVVTPDSILLKPGQLAENEYEIIKQHVETGVGILSGIKQYSKLIDIVKYHHERFDGSGYPYGVKGDEIPPLARILAVADTFDAMTTNRIYKTRKSIGVALSELESLSSIHYDPIVIIAANKALKNIKMDTVDRQSEKNGIEEERLSQFYKDPLTKLFNLEYLNIVLDRDLSHERYKCANVISIKEFSLFNNAKGWEKGDELLKKVSDYLVYEFSSSLIVRIFGDDFVILNTTHLNLDSKKIHKKLYKLCEYKIELDILHYEILSNKDRLELSSKIKKELG